MTETSSPFRLGVTFHSFAHEYLSFIWSFEDMMALTAELGGGVEIVGPSHHRGFPEVSDEFERTFKSAVERYELTPIAYGSYADPFMLPERNLTPDEIFDYVALQLYGAAKLGFPIVRLQHFASVCAERLLPIAEKLNIRLGYELHVPLMLESPRTRELIDQIDRLGSPHLGLIPDAGIFARSISEQHLALGRAEGVSEAIIEHAVAAWGMRTPIDEAMDQMIGLGATRKDMAWIGLIWDTFGFSDPADLANVIHLIVHFHGKFFSMVDGDEPNLRYEEIVQTLVELGYQGWMVSEYEGGTNSLAAVRAHQEMVQKYMKTARG